MIGANNQSRDYKYIVAIGTSTGGPRALTKVLSDLNPNLPAAYVVVQHMPEGYTKALATRLNTLSGLTVKEGEQGEELKRGTVYIAPGSKHLKLSHGTKTQLILTDEEPYKGHKPSVNVMLQSLYNLSASKEIIVVIMTGMGSDGLEGISFIKKQRNVQVIAQDEQTSIVYGMPKSIVQAGLNDYVVPLEEIAKTIEKIMGE